MALSTDSVSNEIWIPSSFFCPLSRQILTEPVTAADGQSYQRAKILKWFSAGNMISPFSKRPLDTQKLIPNHALSTAITEWEEQVIPHIPRQALPLERIPYDQCQCRQYFFSKLTFSGAPFTVPVQVRKVLTSQIRLSSEDLIRIGRYPYLTRLRGICEDGNHTLLATEGAPHGTLLNAIASLHRQNPKSVSCIHRIKMLQQICTTLFFLEQTCSTHNCINDKNILLFHFSETNPEQTLVKLSGYGFKPCTHDPTVRENWSHRTISSRKSWDEKARVFMFGVIALQVILLGEMDNTRSEGSQEEIAAGKRLVSEPKAKTKPLGFPASLWLSIKRCVEEDPAQRPTFAQLSYALLTTDDDDRNDTFDQEMELSIKTLTGKLLFFKVKSDSTTFEVKEVIHTECGIEPSQQRLVYNGRQLEDCRDLRSYDCHTSSVLFLVLRLRCIASPQPASFGKYECVPYDRILMSDNIRRKIDHTSARFVIEGTGGSIKVHPCIKQDNMVLQKSSCKALLKYIEGCARVVCNEQDMRLTLSRENLVEIIGELSMHTLEGYFGTPYDIIRVRRTVSSDTWVPFHIDDSRRTMQVALNSDEDFEGRNLVFATGGGFLEPPRPAGSATTHTSFTVHGVSKLRRGVRYGLFLCDFYGHYERKVLRYLIEAGIKQLEFFEQAVKFLEDLSDNKISGYIQEYIRYMTLSDRTKPPSLGVEILWRTHLHSPMRYQEYCKTLPPGRASAGLVDHIPGDAQSYRVCDPIASSILPTNKINIDLISAIERQKGFMNEVFNSGCLRNSQDIVRGVEEYYIFLREVGEKNTKLEPSLLVDFVWHTHMLFPKLYEEECHLIAGRVIDHEVPR